MFLLASLFLYLILCTIINNGAVEKISASLQTSVLPYTGETHRI